MKRQEIIDEQNSQLSTLRTRVAELEEAKDSKALSLVSPLLGLIKSIEAMLDEIFDRGPKRGEKGEKV